MAGTGAALRRRSLATTRVGEPTARWTTGTVTAASPGQGRFSVVSWRVKAPWAPRGSAARRKAWATRSALRWAAVWRGWRQVRERGGGVGGEVVVAGDGRGADEGGVADVVGVEGGGALVRDDVGELEYFVEGGGGPALLGGRSVPWSADRLGRTRVSERRTRGRCSTRPPWLWDEAQPQAPVTLSVPACPDSGRVEAEPIRGGRGALGVRPEGLQRAFGGTRSEAEVPSEALRGNSG